MKKAKRRKKQFRLSRRRVSLYASFCAEAKNMNAARTEVAFRKGDKVVLKSSSGMSCAVSLFYMETGATSQYPMIAISDTPILTR